MATDEFENQVFDALEHGSTPSAPRDVFILGAGFSKQISQQMPLLSELSQAIALRLPETASIDAIPFMTTNVEMALTFLSQPQPWMTEARRLRNRALFLEIGEAIATEIEHRSASVQACPGWLLRLVHWLHFRKAVVITLNYDTLLESAILAISGGECYPRNLIPFRFAAEQAVLGGDLQADSLELLKLHGSTNWRYSGRDSYSGEALQWSKIRGWSQQSDAGGAGEKVGDSFPLLIPPVTEKAGYFAHHCIQHLWKRASQALGAAKRVFCIGYSLPATDLTMRFLLSDLSMAEPADFYLVNFPSELEHFRDILPNSHFRLQDRFVGPKPICPFVDALFTDEFFPDVECEARNGRGPVEVAVRERLQVRQSIRAALDAGTCSIAEFRPSSITLLIEDARVRVDGRAEIPIRIPWEALEGLFLELRSANQQRIDLDRCDTSIRRYCHRHLGSWLAALLEAAGVATVWFCNNRWVVSPAGSNIEDIARWRQAAQV